MKPMNILKEKPILEGKLIIVEKRFNLLFRLPFVYGGIAVILIIIYWIDVILK